MTKQKPIFEPYKYARISGLLYLIIAVFGAFSIGYVPSVIVIAGDAAATAAQLQSNMTLFKWGVFADVIVLLVEVVLTAFLYVLFRETNPALAMIAGLARLAMVGVMGINILLHILPVVLLSETNYLISFSIDQRQALAMFFFDAHGFGIAIWQLFFCVHLLALGFLVVKSKLVPAVLGQMMFVGSLGYLLQGLAQITFAENTLLSLVFVALLVVVTLGELAFAFWLLIKGVDQGKWRAIAVGT